MESTFSTREKLLWCLSVFLITSTFVLFNGTDTLTLIASLIGVTAILLDAKGLPAGQVLMVLFSLFYGVISYRFRYYGEMITYLGMTMPMSAVAFISWLRHPYEGSGEVEVAYLSRREVGYMTLLTAVVTGVFYPILAYFGTARLLLSTVSVATSFLAVFLTYKRSYYFSLAYAANDVVLIALWLLATFEESRYLSVAVCFVAFFVNDLYAYHAWRKMARRQRAD